MAKPPSEADCVAEQMALTKCVKSKVPLFQQIQNTCAGKLQAYEACLRLNNSDQKKCQADLQSLRECALGVVGKYLAECTDRRADCSRWPMECFENGEH